MIHGDGGLLVIQTGSVIKAVDNGFRRVGGMRRGFEGKAAYSETPELGLLCVGTQSDGRRDRPCWIACGRSIAGGRIVRRRSDDGIV